MTPSSGTTLSGRYTLTEPIASGGMGEVWQARDSVLGRTVAVKVLRPNVDDEPQFAERFRDEARHAAGLSQPNIATVYDYGEDQGTAYLVMELVPGTPLSQLIATRGALGPTVTRSVIGQAALALAAAHEAGVIHRDVKPGNIIVTPDGVAKLTDFGIARAMDSTSLTRPGEVIGTPHYLSPEQAIGQPATGASDLYALGCVAHEMLTGRRPFDAGTPVATALAQIHDAPPPLPIDVPADLRQVVEQCLDKDPARRPRSAAAVAAGLGRHVPGLDAAAGAMELTDPRGMAVAGVAPTSVIPVAQEMVPGQDEAGGDWLGPGDDAMPGQPTPGSRSQRWSEEPPRRSVAWWWIVPAVAAVGVIGYFVVSSLLGSSGTPVTPLTTTITIPASVSTSMPSSTIPTTTETPSSTSTTVQMVNVDLGLYLGRQADEVIPLLQALPVRVRTTTFVTDQYPDGSVVDITPSGELQRGDTVLVSVAVAPPPTSTAGPTG